MNQVMRSFVPLLTVVAAGCASSATEPAPMPLAASIAISNQGVSPQSRVSLVASGGVDPRPAELVMPLKDLKLLVESGDHPRLVELSMPLGDVNVPASTLPPNGLALRDLALSLVDTTHVEVVHAQADALELAVTTPIQLDWSMVLDDGTIYRLGPARTRPVEVAIDVVRSGCATTVTLNAQCLGSCWSIEGIADLSDGALYVEAPAELAPQ
jgi:hypothetical protein